MIDGIVRNLQAEVDVVLRLPAGGFRRLTFVVDTGFAGALSLPTQVVEELELPFVQRMNANLADDSVISPKLHAAFIEWDGELTGVTVLAMGRRPLLGTSLLKQRELTAQFVEDGIVTIETL